MSKKLFFAGVLCLLLMLTYNSADAQTFTWTGGGGDNNWSTGANWGDTAPVSSAIDITLGGSAEGSVTTTIALFKVLYCKHLKVLYY